MYKYSEVLGLPVICAENGTRVGIVKDVIFSPHNKKVVAFLLEQKHCRVFKKVILLTDVASLGNDALIINDFSCAKELRKVNTGEEFQSTGKIKGLKVYSKSGKDYGIVQDILFDVKAGNIEGIEVSDGIIQDIISGRNILPLFGRVSISNENVLVDKETVEEMIETGGGLKNKLSGG